MTLSIDKVAYHLKPARRSSGCRPSGRIKALRALTRIYLEPGHLDASIGAYERLFGDPCRLRFDHPAVGLELAEVGAVLLLCSTEEARAVSGRR